MPRLLPLLLKISLPLIIIDQLSKWWIVLHFKQPHIDSIPEFIDTTGLEQINVIDGTFRIIRLHNQGVAFGFGNGTAWAPIVFLIIPFLALIFITILWRKNIFTGIAKYSAPLLFAGVVGNLLDRLLQGFWLKGLEDHSFWERLGEGYVVDFLDFTVPFTHGYHWPSFNVADSCITVAAILLFISAFQSDAKQKA